MAIATAARSIFRSPSVRVAASRISSAAKAARSPFRSPSRSPLSHRIFRCPSEMSACLESLQPYHTVTASALMTSKLTDSLSSYSWLSEEIYEDMIETQWAMAPAPVSSKTYRALIYYFGVDKTR